MSSDKLFFACNISVLRAEMSSFQRSVIHAQLINIELGFQLSCLSSCPHANSTTLSGLYPTNDRLFNHSSCITKLKIMVQLFQNDILKASIWTIMSDKEVFITYSCSKDESFECLLISYTNSILVEVPGKHTRSY